MTKSGSARLQICFGGTTFRVRLALKQIFAHQTRALTLAIGVVAIIPLTSEANNGSDGAGNELDEIIVNAVRSNTSIREIARSVSVVDQDEIQVARQQLALDEALAGVPGLYIQNRYNFAQDLRVSLRGFGARSAFGIRGIKVIVDGIPATLPDGQAGVDSIDIGSAGRIEVLRGPSSYLYGNASGGVIAIETERGTEKPFISGTLASGSYGFNRYQVKVGGRSARVDYLVNASQQSIDGYREQSRAKGIRVNGRLDFRLAERDRLKLIFNHTDQPVAEDPGGITLGQALSSPRSARDANIRFDAGESLDQQRVGLVYETDRTGGDLQVRNYYVWRDFDGRRPFSGGGSIDLRRFFFGLGAQYSLDNLLPEKTELTAGFDIERQDDWRRRFDNLDGSSGPLVIEQNEIVDSIGVYLHGNYQINDRWIVSAGLRYDEIQFNVVDKFLEDGDDSGVIRFDGLSPYIGVHFDLNRSAIFASYGSSFETPTTTELANPDGTGGLNQMLAPQEAESFELGWKAGTEDQYFELAVFGINLKDELVPFEHESQPGRIFFANAGRSSRRGLEMAYSWTGKSGFEVALSYTLSRFRFDEFIDDDGNDFSGKSQPGVPSQFGNVALKYARQSGLKIVFETYFSGLMFADNSNDVSIKDYLASSLRFSKEFDRGNWKYRPYFGINNIFNQRYNSNVRINAFGGRYYEPAPDRNFYAGITVGYQ